MRLALLISPGGLRVDEARGWTPVSARTVLQPGSGAGSGAGGDDGEAPAPGPGVLEVLDALGSGLLPAAMEEGGVPVAGAGELAMAMNGALASLAVASWGVEVLVSSCAARGAMEEAGAVVPALVAAGRTVTVSRLAADDGVWPPGMRTEPCAWAVPDASCSAGEAAGEWTVESVEVGPVVGLLVEAAVLALALLGACSFAAGASCCTRLLRAARRAAASGSLPSCTPPEARTKAIRSASRLPRLLAQDDRVASPRRHARCPSTPLQVIHMGVVVCCKTPSRLPQSSRSEAMCAEERRVSGCRPTRWSRRKYEIVIRTSDRALQSRAPPRAGSSDGIAHTFVQTTLSGL